ncbi:MAG TPA: hypothetical protein VNR64_12400 [Vicinamibacterales bacterium]|nr:hypothetical protein [Vicinamibacterales bacterium]
MDYYLIWSIEHDAWWRPGERGYTRTLTEAGRYAEPRARAIVQRANMVRTNECLIPLAAAGLSDQPAPPPPCSDRFGDLLQYLAFADPAYLRELEGHVRAHVANVVRR